MHAYETWTIVDSTGPPRATDDGESDVAAGDVTAPNQHESAADWESAEWGKLTGAWRAPLPNGEYRVKRISPGKEILEVYDADGNLLRESECDMFLSRASGLNFFTVNNRRRVGSAGDAGVRGAGPSYTSIYKVHDGKWYEQLRGIFAENENLRPDMFLVYERLEQE
jgi:hypothetical protein